VLLRSSVVMAAGRIPWSNPRLRPASQLPIFLTDDADDLRYSKRRAQADTIAADERWAIRLNTRVISVWEHDEQEACMQTFAHLIGLGKSKKLLVVRVPAGGLSEPLDAQQSLN
jgi:hypothetical protein